MALLTVLVAYFPATAQAFSVTPVQQAVAQAIAVRHWGDAPCGGNVPVSWTHLGRTKNARSYWLDMGTGPAGYLWCSIQFSYDVGWNWPKFCTVLEHEYGHLLGYQHDAGLLMNRYYVGSTRECAPVARPMSVRHLTHSR